MKFKHNKRINTGLLYELLFRDLAESFIDKDLHKSDKILTIIKKYYSPGNVLNEENNIYSVILNNKAQNKKNANNMIDEILTYSNRLNAKAIDSEKSKLLREIDVSLNKDFFNRRIKNYKTYASIHQLIQIDRSNSPDLNMSLKRLKLKESICNFLLVNDSNKVDALEASKKYNNLVVKLVFEKYNEKYSDKLTKNQKILIKNLVENNDKDFKKYIEETIKATSIRIKKYKTNYAILENKVLNVKFNHICKKWQVDSNTIRKNLLTESSLTMLLKYVGLLDEIAK